jgi:hypothetical protein
MHDTEQYCKIRLVTPYSAMQKMKYYAQCCMAEELPNVTASSIATNSNTAVAKVRVIGQHG